MTKSISPKTVTRFIEVHSEEVNEIINRPPSWLVKWGISMFFFLLAVLFCSCWLVRYPDIISTSFTLSASEGPRSVVVRSDSRLAKVMVKDGQNISQGDVMAVCESTAEPEDVFSLNQTLADVRALLEQSKWNSLSNVNINRHAKLGNIQSDYQTFAQRLLELRGLLAGGYYVDKRILLNNEINDLKELENNLNEQLVLQKRDFEIGLEEFNMQERLYKNKVISSLEFKKEQAKLLAREMPLKHLSSQLIQIRSSQSSKRKEILELDNTINEHKNNFYQALQTLQNAIETWKRDYVISAPVTGKVSYSTPLLRQQHISIGQEIFTVEPNSETYQGLLKIPQVNSGKLREGQKVLIKLDGYPYREYGILEGYLSRLSAVSGKDSIFWGTVALPSRLVTKYGRSIPYKNGLKGTGEVVTADRVLGARLFDLVRNGGSSL